MGLYTTVMEEMTEYTGLSPAAFFTIAALMVVVYKMVCGMFVSPEDFNQPPIVTAGNIRSNLFNSSFSGTNDGNPVQLGDMSEQQLRAYNGSDSNKPILMAIKGQIYDVSSSRYPNKILFFLFQFSAGSWFGSSKFSISLSWMVL